MCINYIVIHDSKYSREELKNKLEGALFSSTQETLSVLRSIPGNQKIIKYESDHIINNSYHEKYNSSFFDFGDKLYGVDVRFSAGDLFYVPTNSDCDNCVPNAVGFNFRNDHNLCNKENLFKIIFKLINTLDISDYKLYFRTDREDIWSEFTPTVYEHYMTLEERFSE
jgi:hypothetical protein